MAERVPSLRGSILGGAHEYLKKNFGEEFLERVYQQLSAKDREALKPPILSLGWYPVESVQHFEECYQKELIRLGKNPDVVKAEMQQSFGVVMKALYYLIFSLVGATSLISKLPMLTERIYDCISVNVLENHPGSCLIRYEGAREAQVHFRAGLVSGLQFVFSLGGIKWLGSQIEKDQTEGDRFLLEIRIKYQP